MTAAAVTNRQSGFVVKIQLDSFFVSFLWIGL